MLSNRVVFGPVVQEVTIHSPGRCAYAVGTLRFLKSGGHESNITGTTEICGRGVD